MLDRFLRHRLLVRLRTQLLSKETLRCPSDQILVSDDFSSRGLRKRFADLRPGFAFILNPLFEVFHIFGRDIYEFTNKPRDSFASWSSNHFRNIEILENFRPAIWLGSAPRHHVVAHDSSPVYPQPQV